MPNVLLLGDLNTRKIYMNKCHMLKRSKNANEKPQHLLEKSCDSSDQIFCCWVMNRQFMQDNSFGIIKSEQWT